MQNLALSALGTYLSGSYSVGSNRKNGFAEIWYVKSGGGLANLISSKKKIEIFFDFVYLSVIYVKSGGGLATTLKQFYSHYENTPIQVYWKFYHQEKETFQIKNSDIFHNPAQNIDCGYSLEPPRRGGSNEYPQSMFFTKIRKNNVYPCKPQFYYIKMGMNGVKII